MPSTDHCFTLFRSNIANCQLPERFTFPFYYQPHPLAELASKELQQHLSEQAQWQHNFGLNGNPNGAIGKMFGVLVVQNSQGNIGYLSAFSGKLAEQNMLDGFVPPVFDMLERNSFFLKQQLVINQLTARLSQLEIAPELLKLSGKIAQEQQSADEQICAYREVVIQGRKDRKAKRAQAKNLPDAHEHTLALEQLSKESVAQKNQLLAIKAHWQQRIERLQQQLQPLLAEITELKEQRKILSNTLQHKLFAQYRFLNIEGNEQDLNQLFKNTINPIPPAGAGECAAPKLLHYAFKHGLKPLAMAEFWWGASPKSEIRQHQNYYPACQGKCLPILTHMLKGMEVDANPLLSNPAEGKSLPIIYQDQYMLIINKPSEFLSVPGKNITDSVYARIKRDFPDATGSLIVHRLDMSTSGLMVIALTARAHKNLQQQFIKRTVEKRYIALLAGNLAQEQGSIELPLRVDLDDRPRQLVCYDYGKAAETSWQALERITNNTGAFTKVYLYPKTGRTHQLRVHCAHVLGLNTPIVGDDLYGKAAQRLCLHAQYLALDHPITKERLTFEVPEDF